MLYTCSDHSSSSFHLKGEIEFLNRNGDLRLGIQQEHHSAVYAAAGIMYFVIFFLWSLSLIYHRRVIALPQIIILIGLGGRCFQMLGLSLYFSLLNSKGEMTDSLADMNNIVQDIANLTGMVVFITVSSGWRITREEISPHEKRFFTFTVSLFLLLMLIHASCDSGNCEFSEPLKYIGFSFVLLGSLIAMHVTRVHLRHILANDTPDTEKSILNAYAREDIYRLLKWIFLAYLLLPFAIFTTNFAFFSWRDEWAFILLLRVALLVFECVMLSMFMPTRNNDLYRRFV